MINVTKIYLPDKEKYQKYIDEIYANGWVTNNGKITFWGRVKRRLKWKLIKAGILKNKNSYTDYPNWIGDGRISSEIKEIINEKSSYIKKYPDIDIEEKYLIPHLEKKENYSEQILRTTTIELYLQRVFHRSNVENN